MKAKPKGLQKFTDIKTKIDKLLTQNQITKDDTKQLSKAETDYFNKVLTDKCNTLTGVDRDKLLNQIDTIIDDNSRNEIWENNHSTITYAISTLMQDYGRMPTKQELATKTNLSRQTIHKHMKDYASHPLYLSQLEQFRFMSAKVLAKVFQFAVNGDIAAAKLYFNVIGIINGQPSTGTFIQNQNNYIQINGNVISQEAIKQLTADQLGQIEAVLSKVNSSKK